MYTLLNYNKFNFANIHGISIRDEHEISLYLLFWTSSIFGIALVHGNGKKAFLGNSFLVTDFSWHGGEVLELR